MKTNINLRAFLIALAAGSLFMQKSSEATIIDHDNPVRTEGEEGIYNNLLAAEQLSRHSLEKADPEFFALQKQAGSVVRKLRIQAGIGEGTVMKAMGLDPAKEEDVTTYMNWEQDSQPIELTADHIKAIAKVVKADPVVMATQIINSESSAPADPNNPNPADPNNPNPADPNNPAQKSAKVTKSGKEEDDFSKVAARIAKSIDANDLKVLNEALTKSKGSTATGSEVVTKSAEDVKLEKMQAFGRAVSGIKEGSNLEKTGVIVPEDIAPGGILNPTLGTTILEQLQVDTVLLKDVQRVVLTSYKQEQHVITRSRRAGTQLATNDNITGGQTITGVPFQFEAHDVDFPMLFSDRTMLQYQGNLPQFDNQVSSFLMAGIPVDIEDLSLNGTAYTYAGGDMLTISKGYFQLVADGATGANAWRQIDASVAGITTVMGSMDALMQALVDNKPEKYTMDHEFIMSFADFKTYEAELKAARKSDDPLINGAPKIYSGHKIRVSNLVPQGKMLFTRPKNLVYAFVNGSQEGVRVDRERVTKGYSIVVSTAVDFRIVDLDETIALVP